MVVTITVTDGSSSGSTDSSPSGMTPPEVQESGIEGVPLPSLDTEKIMEKLSAIERKSVCCTYILCITFCQ